MFKPIQNEKIYMSVIKQVRGAIANGTFSAGDRLPPERELAAMFAVSRASIRQAISALEALGAVEIRRGDGTYVAEANTDDFVESFSRFLTEQQITPQEILQTRAVVECGIARICAEQTDPELVEDLENLISQEHEKALEGDQKELVTINQLLHLGLIGEIGGHCQPAAARLP